MGLTATLNNALSGMRAGNTALDVVSRNVANSGTPGYHRQSSSVIDGVGANSTYAMGSVVTRAFNQSLQQYYTNASSDSGFTNIRANLLDRLQTYFGKPGATGSLDKAYSDFTASLNALATSTDNYGARADTVAKAQALAATLNGLSTSVQGLRRETEGKIASDVDTLNQALAGLAKLNSRLGDTSIDGASRSALQDQRDRLVGQVAELIDVRVDYRADGSVGLMTRSGVGLLDGKPSVFEFSAAGSLSAASLYNSDAEKSGVGSLVVRTPGGLTLDLGQQDVIRSGELGGLLELRDRTLVTAQSQLDQVAAGLAQALSTVKTAGTAASSGPASGYSVDLSAIQSGNDFVVDYTQGGVTKQIRVVRVDDAGKLPLDYVDNTGARVVGMDFSGGAGAIATKFNALFGPGLAASGTGSTLTVLDDGAFGSTDMIGLTARSTVSGTQSGDLALSLFTDSGDADFTNSLDGQGQLLGFAGRIRVNSAVVNDSKLLAQFTPTTSVTEDDRVNFLVDALETMRFGSTTGPAGLQGSARISGSVDDLISQTINYQGNTVASSISDADTQSLTMQTLTDRMDGEYGVDVDQEMARLMELQNAYAANARVMSVVQDLLDQLMQA